jgi:hypothetical protein
MIKLPHAPTVRNPASAVERLSDHLRWRAMPWPAKRLVRHYGLHAATAAVIAEMIYTAEARQ